MAWGDSGMWGVGPWGTGVFAVAAARAIAENVVRVLFSEVPVRTGLLTAEDGLRPQNYAMTVVGDARPVRVVDVAVVAESELAVDVGLDRAMSASPAQYWVTALGVRSETGLPLDLFQSSWEFPGLLLKRVPSDTETTGSKTRDFASPQQVRDALDPVPDIVAATLGALPIDDTGDYAFDEGASNLRKRIFRRLVTLRGGFYHLPRYGLGLPAMLKKGVSGAQLRKLQDDASEQLSSEPDLDGAVISVTHTQTERGGIARVRVTGNYRGRRFEYSLAFRTR